MRSRERGSEGGYMLVELLVVISLIAIVGGLLSDAVISAFHSQRDITARATDLDGLRQAMERTTRDMRAAQTVNDAEGQKLILTLPSSTGGTRVITWTVTTTNGSSSLLEAESDFTAANAETDLAPTVVLSNLDPATALFSYTRKPGYTATIPGSVDAYCQETAKPGSYEQRCVGAVSIDLKALLPGHPDLELTDTVQLRNVT